MRPMRVVYWITGYVITYCTIGAIVLLSGGGFSIKMVALVVAWALAMLLLRMSREFVEGWYD